MIRKIDTKSSLSEQAYNYLKEKILSGEIRDGDILTEQSIGDILDMSRTPVKNALIKLENEHFVKSIKGVGTIVIGLSIRDLADIYEVRISLETLALKTSINRIPPRHLKIIKTNLLEIEKKYQENLIIDSMDVLKIDEDFHSLIISNSTNNYVKELIHSLEKRIERYQFEAYALTDTGRESTKHHLEIIKYIEENNYEEAKKSLNNHISWSFGVLNNAFSNLYI